MTAQCVNASCLVTVAVTVTLLCRKKEHTAEHGVGCGFSSARHASRSMTFSGEK